MERQGVLGQRLLKISDKRIKLGIVFQKLACGKHLGKKYNHFLGRSFLHFPLFGYTHPVCEHGCLQVFEHLYYDPVQVVAVHVLGWHEEMLSAGVYEYIFLACIQMLNIEIVLLNFFVMAFCSISAGFVGFHDQKHNYSFTLNSINNKGRKGGGNSFVNNRQDIIKFGCSSPGFEGRLLSHRIPASTNESSYKEPDVYNFNQILVDVNEEWLSFSSLSPSCDILVLLLYGSLEKSVSPL
ncbi:hypothetical protein E2320_008353, partial [Naja naja]